MNETKLQTQNNNRDVIKQQSKQAGQDQWQGQLTASEKQLLSRVTQEYGLDPVLKELIVLGGNLYITSMGLTKIASRSGEYAGCKYEQIEGTQDDEIRYRCTIKKVLANGELGEFEGIGRANPSNCTTKTAKWLDEMAQTRARCRAIRSAFPISLPSYEECFEDAEPEKNTKAIEVKAKEIEEKKQEQVVVHDVVENERDEIEELL